MTIHKSQGSEYPVVILPLLSGPQVLMNRNLLYTAVTRAKRCVVIIGSRDTVNNMIKNVSPTTRYSGLRDAVEDIYAAEEDLK
jgi:exodeoxyribonuclease V alpha subunit